MRVDRGRAGEGTGVSVSVEQGRVGGVRLDRSRSGCSFLRGLARLLDFLGARRVDGRRACEDATVAVRAGQRAKGFELLGAGLLGALLVDERKH